MKTIYNVYHLYDVDGGFGDAVDKQTLLFTTDNKEIAEDFVSKYDNDHIYDIPYAELHTGKVVVEEVNMVEIYEDIPQDIIQWGESNSKAEDYTPEDIEPLTDEQLLEFLEEKSNN